MLKPTLILPIICCRNKERKKEKCNKIRIQTSKERREIQDEVFSRNLNIRENRCWPQLALVFAVWLCDKKSHDCQQD